MKASVTEYEYEPVPGLPENLPSDEEILWQGKPCWQTLARRAFHTRKVVGYFLLLWVVNIAWALHGGLSLAHTLASSLMLVIPALLVLGLLNLLAWAMARSSLYTITNRRVVLRSGVAIPMTINLPFAKIAGAALREYGDGQGDIPLALTPETRVPYFALWPHARPWRFVPAVPMLRAIPDVSAVAKILAGALQRAIEQTHPEAPDAQPDPQGAGTTQIGAGAL